MLYLHDAKVVFLCTTKTASSSIESALLPYAGISFTASPRLKHMPYRRFLKDIAPLIRTGHGDSREDYEVVCVMREPIAWLESWFRYRSRDALKNARGRRRENYCGDVSFSEFVNQYCSAAPAPYAAVGDQTGTFMGQAGTIAVDRIFPYERLQHFVAYIEERLGTRVEMPQLNRSPHRDLTLDPGSLARLRDKMKTALALHACLRPDGLLADWHGAKASV